MDSPAGFTPDSDANTPATDQTRGGAVNGEVRRILEDMYTRQQQMEAELASTRVALNKTEAERRQRGAYTTNTPPSEGRPPNDLLATLTQALSAFIQLKSEKETAVPREWKPPTRDGQAETFRDYPSRLRGSDRVRSASKPPFPAEYYWNAIYDTLPSRERARMRHFWEKGSAEKGKDPEAFFAQLEDVFADSNEQAKALEQLTTLKHAIGQPWHEHQLEFDGLLLSAGGHSGLNLHIQIQNFVFRFNSIQIPIIQYSGFIQYVIPWQVLADVRVSEVFSLSTVYFIPILFSSRREQVFVSRAI